jgi:high-affinity nickel-transport protein
MESLPTHWLSLVAVVFLLGLKHGLDPDHLAAIDGLTRFNAGRRPLVSRWSGFLFSAVAVATLATEWRVPAWLDGVGTWISIGFLAALGVANLAAVLRTPKGEMVRPVGMKSRAFQRLTHAEHPVVIAAVGAAFALSFDTFSQAVLFSVTGSHVAGWVFAFALGLVFTAGMMATDALNGLWVSRLVRAADTRAAAASRVMSFAVAVVALAIAALAIARRVLPALDARLDSWDTALGVAVVVAVAAAYAVALRITREARWTHA